ncbi:hypothetical protein [Acetoanaerobium sticklandii]|uniref:hypothetical protein n=1 Tax=Acetoanaerobium sticklandii TaxID=1511 RepID=UPI003A8ECE28
MKHIPNKLECSYCARNLTHGGECKSPAYSDRGCMAFKMDERGCIKKCNGRIEFPINYTIPMVGEWRNDFENRGIDTSIKINRIIGIDWNSRKGTIIIICEFEYFENEFHENFVKKKPALKIVK